MAKNKLLVATQAPFSNEANEELARIAEENNLDTTVIKGEDILTVAELKDTNALVVRSDKVTKEVIDKAPNLKLIIRGGAGYNNIDVDYCTEKGIMVMNTPGQNSNGVAELVFNLATNLLRKTNLLDATTKDGFFEKGKYKGNELKNKKIGIHGFGYIGQLVAQIANGFGMTVYAYDPFVSEEIAKAKGAILAESPQDLYKDAFMISLHMPKNKHTEGIVNYKLLELMLDNGMLINTARAEIINEDDLQKIMDEKAGFRYGADVHAGGDKAGDRRFAKYLERAVLTPHIGAGTTEANYNCAVAAANQTVGFFDKGDMACVVNKDIVPFWMKDYAILAQKLGYINSKLMEGQPKEIKVVTYDDLTEFAGPLIDNVVKGMMADDAITAPEARDMAQKNGIIITPIEPDKNRRRGNAITADFLYEADNEMQLISTRGTIMEDEMKISRIAKFYNVDFEIEAGIALMFMYKDCEGMADKIGEVFCKHGYGKTSGRFKADREHKNAIFMFYLNKSDADIAEVEKVADITKNTIEGIYEAKVLDFR